MPVKADLKVAAACNPNSPLVGDGYGCVGTLHVGIPLAQAWSNPYARFEIVPYRGRSMQPISRSETRLNHPRTTMRLQAFIAELQRRVQLLSADIHAEEKQAGVFDSSDIAYPALARNLRAQRDNLLLTITMLENRFVGKDVTT